VKLMQRWESVGFLTSILTVQFITSVTVFLNIPIARQVIGFLYLTIVPGVILLSMLRIHNLDLIESVLLSIGLSISFLISIGFLTNELGPLIGIPKPLSLVPLMIIINSAVLIMCFLSCILNKEAFNNIKSLKMSYLITPFVFLPLLSVAGTVLVKASGNNSILLLMIIISGLVVGVSTLSEKLVSPNYPMALLMISIALLFHGSLISNYLLGNDVHLEYYIFKLTESNSYWDSTIPYKYELYTSTNAMLSLTVLPTIYSNILNMEGTWILKIIYPLIFSLVPLGLYQLHQTKTGKKVAFLSAFFFMSNNVFFIEMLGLYKQMVAELFYVLLFLVLFNKKMSPLDRKVCFIIFSFSLVVSHYSTSYIFMFLIFSTWLFMFFLKNKSMNITLSLIALFFSILFSWYIYVSVSGPFNDLMNMGDHVFRSLVEFADPESRGQEVLRGLGMEGAMSFWQLMSRMFFYATEFFIIVGFITLITKRKRIFDWEYVGVLSVNMALLGLSIILPGLAESLRMSRLYHILLILLAPLCILGGETLFRFVSNSKTKFYIFLLFILIPFFLFQTGFVYEITGDYSWSIPLSKYRMSPTAYSDLGFVDEQSVFGAEWLSKNVDIEYTPMCADIKSVMHALNSYGMISRDRMDLLSNTTTVPANGIVYLSRVSVIDGIILGRGNVLWNTTEISSTLNKMNKICSNGGCEIYEMPP